MVDEIGIAGGAVAHATDISDLVGVEAMIAAAVQRWGRVDILANDAGILRDKSSA